MKINGQFVPHRAAMLKSLAWSELGLCARRILDRLEIEHLDHGGKENGQLEVSYQQFEDFGIGRRHLIRALHELKAHGFIRSTRGKPAKGQFRAPNLYSITYLPIGNAAPTDDWKRFKTASPPCAKTAETAA